MKLPSFLEKIETKTKNWPVFLLVLLFLVLILRLPSLFEPCWYGDEGVYLTLGQSIRQGQTLYRDIHDNKPPLLYWLAAIAGNVFWFRFILLVWMMGTTIAFFKLTNKFFKSKNLTLVLTTLFVLLTSLPVFEGLITNAEHFFIGLVILGVYFFLEKKLWRSGLLMGTAFLFKSHPFFDWLALLIFSFLLSFASAKNKKDFFDQIKAKMPLVIGFLVLPLLIFIFYALKPGALFYYWESAWLQNLPYLSSWGGQKEASLLSNQLFWRGIILVVVLAGVFWQRKFFFKNKRFLLVFLWSVLAIFGAFLSSRPYSHYLLQVVAPLLILSGFLFVFLFEKKIRFFLIGIIPVVFLVAGFFGYRFYTYAVIPYYQNFVQFALGKKDRQEYFNWFDQDVSENYQAAEFISEALPWGEKIFVWGNQPHIYALSRRLPAGRYTTAYHIRDFDRFQEVFSAIKKNLPKIVVYDRDYQYPFPDLLTFLNKNYYPIEEFGSLQVWFLFQEI
ncbi:MAG: hypothetical protein XD98_0363 [Microgenomates bacterium 39_6]|nr:MAG: hypothetical protein XD98_0363 [Microgenomates bacterium 39_6]